MLIRDEAIALRRLDYSETSQIIALFTRAHGQVRAIAKGIKRSTKSRFAVGIDLLDVGAVVLSARGDRGGGLATVTEWKQTQAFSGLRDRLERLHGAQYVAEVVSHLSQEWDPHPELFDAMIATLRALATADDVLGLLVRFQLDLLRVVGSLPRFDACAACGRPTELSHFSAFEGGMVCRSCAPRLAEKRAVTERTLRTLQTGEGEAFAGPFNLLNYHLSHTMGRASQLAAKLAPPTHQPPATQ